MIQKTIRKRAKRKFDMPLTVSKTRKALRKRYKKTVTKKEIRAAWKDLVEHTIVDPLIKDGFVQIDKHFSLEIVGTRINKNKRAYDLMSKGFLATKGGLKPLLNLNQNRRGYTYRIEMKDTRTKGLIFHACPYIRKRVNEALKWTNIQYRIEE